MPPLTGDFRIGLLEDISESKDQGSSSFKSGNVGMSSDETPSEVWSLCQGPGLDRLEACCVCLGMCVR